MQNPYLQTIISLEFHWIIITMTYLIILGKLGSGKLNLLENLEYMDFVFITIGLKENNFWKDQWKFYVTVKKLILIIVFAGLMRLGAEIGMHKNARYYWNKDMAMNLHG